MKAVFTCAVIFATICQLMHCSTIPRYHVNFTLEATEYEFELCKVPPPTINDYGVYAIDGAQVTPADLRKNSLFNTCKTLKFHAQEHTNQHATYQSSLPPHIEGSYDICSKQMPNSIRVSQVQFTIPLSSDSYPTVNVSDINTTPSYFKCVKRSDNNKGDVTITCTLK